jgi:hypothetical protein
MLQRGTGKCVDAYAAGKMQQERLVRSHVAGRIPEFAPTTLEG